MYVEFLGSHRGLPHRSHVCRFDSPKDFAFRLWGLIAGIAFLIVALSSPALAAEGEAGEQLVIEDIFPDLERDTVDVVLRNESSRTITAWCLELGGGPSHGEGTIRGTSTEDRYAQLGAEDPHSPIAPGESVVHRLSVPGLNLSPDRFDRGDFSVLSLDVGCVFFDDGGYLGKNTEDISDILLRRLAELKAAMRLQDELEETQGADEALAWMRRIVEESPPRGQPPVLLYRATRAELLEAREQGAYRRLLSEPAAAVRLHDLLGFSSLEARDWLQGALEEKIDNGFRNLPESFLREKMEDE